MKKFSLAAAILGIGLGGAALAADVPAYVTAAVADATRPADDRAAEAIRAPAETLAFAGVKPGMVVGELYPCGGYFSHMISDVVGPKGKVYGLETTRWKTCLPTDQKMAGDLPVKNMTVEGFEFGAFSLPEKVDLFWITQ